jgi:hypothetical protein
VAARTSTIVVAIVLATATGYGTTACGSRSAALPVQPSPEVTTPAHRPSPVPVPTVQPTPPVVSPSGPAPFGEAVAVPCAGRPSADQVVALLRRTPKLLPRGATVTVRTGPVCAGSWQYTIVSVPDREALEVVTKGPPGSLVLVTAGTDVCSIEVRTAAPIGIRTAAHCT